MIGAEKKEFVNKFYEIVAEYSSKDADEINENMNFRDDLGFSSLDFMTFLGELEDNFDLSIDATQAFRINTVGEALNYFNEYKV